MYSIDELINLGIKRLEHIDINKKLEVIILLSYALNRDKLYIMSNGSEIINDYKPFLKLIDRRAHFEPVEYIVNSVSFYDSYFYINRGALIPRPESELIITNLVKIVDVNKSYNIAEIGVGSGVLIICLAKVFSNSTFVGSDISSDALKIAKKNLKLHCLEHDISLHQTNLLDNIDFSVDILVSNPPYVEEGYIGSKSLDYEPSEALYAKGEGTEVIYMIIDLFFSKKCKVLICEIGYNHEKLVKEFIEVNYCSYKLEFYFDYSSLIRGFILKREIDEL